MDFSGLDRHGYYWLYEQVADIVETAIRSGELAPGAMIPGEHSLSQQADVSRSVIRRAMGLLRARGIVITRPGRGSFAVRDLPPEA